MPEDPKEQIPNKKQVNNPGTIKREREDHSNPLASLIYKTVFSTKLNRIASVHTLMKKVYHRKLSVEGKKIV